MTRSAARAATWLGAAAMLGGLVLVSLSPVPISTSLQAQSQKDAAAHEADEIARLRARIAELEAQVAKLQAGGGYSGEALEAEENVKPGINDLWMRDDIGPLIGRLEVESREIFNERFNIAALVGPPRGAVVADIGAGSGFMTNIFARQVGPEGKVFAVEINPVLVGHIMRGAEKAGLTNIEPIVCTTKSAELPPASVDIVFICDTYHHFEFPKNTMTSIWHALKPGGQVVLVDFHRIEGVTEQWIMEHVRAGEEVFTREIIDAGFELVNEHDVPFLKDNYVLRFRKVARERDEAGGE